MFDQTFVDTHVEARKPAAVAASFLFQTLAVGSLLLIPLLRVEMLPLPKLEGPVVWKIPLTPPEPPPIAQQAVHRPRPTPTLALRGPITIPRDILMVTDDPTPIGPAMPAFADVADRIMTLITPVAPPPPPLPPVQASAPKPIQQVEVGGKVQAARLVFGPRPEYPSTAKITRTQGVVRLAAIVGADGNIRSLQVRSGHPLLIKAAMDAVARWRYQPTLLNGTPVEVATEIEVNFTLSQ
jgi:protein TonB